MRRRASVLGWLAVLAAGLLAALPLTTSAHAAVPVLVIDGKGFGHGVGMAQDGAYWMGRAGASTADILAHFYPGTGLGTATGDVRVVVVTPRGADIDVAFPAGGEVRDAKDGPQSPGFPVPIAPGGVARFHVDGGRYSVQTASPATTRSASATSSGAAPVAAPPAPTTAVTPTTTTTTTAPPPAGEPQVHSAQVLPGSTTSTTAPLLTLPTTTTTSPPTTTPAPAPAPGTTTTTRPASGGGTTPGTAPPAPSPDPGPTPAPTPAATSTRPLWAASADGTPLGVPARGRSYRGLLEAAGTDGQLRLVNQVNVEDYLKGMGEVRDPSWPAVSLQSQAIVARTYALRAMLTGGELCDDDHCQTYLGSQAEYEAMDHAVDDTAGKVVVFGQALASTVYSTNGGGITATPQEGFGPAAGNQPYLEAAPYQTSDPLPWTVTVSLADVASRLAYRGQLNDVRVASSGPSGRALSLVLDGDNGQATVSGLDFARSFGLRSTLLTLHIGSADEAPPPPAAVDVIQAPPDQATALVTAPALTFSPLGSPADGSAVAALVPARPRPRGAGTGTPLLPLAASCVAAAVLAVAGADALMPRHRPRHRRSPTLD